MDGWAVEVGEGCRVCPGGRGEVVCMRRAETEVSVEGEAEGARRCRTGRETAEETWSWVSSDSESVWAGHNGKGCWETVCSDLRTNGGGKI